MVHQYREVEDKYDVGPDFALPGLAVDSVKRIEAATYQLEATYYDTPDAALRRHAITLRRRTGGKDAGWHLKVPAAVGRTEIRVDSQSAAVPRELATLLLGVRRGQKLVPTVTVSTTRDSHQLLDGDGRMLAEVADDKVHTVTSTGSSAVDDWGAARVDDWREIEVELAGAGDEDLLAQVGKRLRKAGAQESLSSSKSGRALGDPPEVSRPKQLARLVDDYVQTQYAAIVNGDLALRRDINAVHKTRVAVRRLRSTVKTFGPLFDQAGADRLEAELVWYASLLGDVRDLDVQGRRLSDKVAELPKDLVIGPVAARVESTVASQRATRYNRLRRAMNGKRYLALLTLVEQWRVDPPWTEAADTPKKTAETYVAAAEKTMRRRLDRAAQPEADDDLLHSARKAEKRYRYACELAQSVLSGRTEQAIDRAKALQTLLGEFQDSVVCAAMLRQLGMRAGTSGGENGFTYGLLYAQEWATKRSTRAQVIREFC